MRLSELAEAVPQKKWGNKLSMNSLLKLPVKNSDDRFHLLLEILSFRKSLEFPKWKIISSKIGPKFIQTELYKAASFAGNKSLMSSIFRDVCEGLFKEFEKFSDNISLEKVAEGLDTWDDVYIKKDSFEKFDINISEEETITIRTVGDISRLSNENLGYAFDSLKEVSETEDENILEYKAKDSIGMKERWIMIDMIISFFHKGSVTESEKFKKGIKKS